MPRNKTLSEYMKDVPFEQLLPKDFPDTAKILEMSKFAVNAWYTADSFTFYKDKDQFMMELYNCSMNLVMHSYGHLIKTDRDVKEYAQLVMEVVQTNVVGFMKVRDMTDESHEREAKMSLLTSVFATSIPVWQLWLEDRDKQGVKK